MATSSTPDLHSNWLTVGEGLLLTKTVLEPYINQVVNNWHQMLLKRLEKEGPCTSPSTCNLLNHASLCPSCKVWFDELRRRHTGNVNKICWNNTDCTQWAKQQGAWEVAKVFMANLGNMKSQVTDEKSTDIAGLLNILRFFPNEAFTPVSRPGRTCREDVSNEARNPWAHSPRQEMTTEEKKKALNSLRVFLQDNALKLAKGVGKGLNDLQTLDSDGITDISISERKCLKLLAQELPAEVSKIEADVKALSSTSNLQEHDIRQVKSTISDISSSVDLLKRMLENDSSKNQQQWDDVLLLKNNLSELEQAVEIKLTNLEEKQNHLESRQDTFEEKVLENLDEVKTQMQAISEKINSDAVCEPRLQSCLPDFQDKVFGRNAVIDEVASLIIQHQKPCVVLTGAPGFGKTTVAINLAHKLKANKVCLFVSLREMRSIKDVCSALLAYIGQHPKENEKKELLHWARSLKEEVVFILDNAEEILQVDNNAFCGLLQDLRTINSRCIQFLITSRETFAISTMEITPVEIKKLNTEEGKQVIRSMVPEGNTSGDSEIFTELVNLCGGIPLALIMIGSILGFGVDITSLIEELESFSMQTLENPALPSYHRSIRAAFECSFQKLENYLKAKLVQLSVFRGPFTQQAAASILDCQERPIVAGKVLKELTNKSLLTKSDSSKRYEMHSLIQKYLKEIKSEPYHNDVDAAANKFIDYYASVVIEGHKLFWSKDEFKRSIEMFRNDNLNIEIALEMCYQDPEKMKKFFSFSVWSVSMYLEMCISLEKLNKFLESCSSSAASQNDKGMEMEAQCFLAYYEWKKARDSEKYKTHFSDAKKLYEEEENSLRPSQKWLYKHSYGLHLDLNRIYDTSNSTLDEAFQVAKEAEQIAERNTEGTDLSLTLNQLGIIEKHRKNYEGAECHLKKSHEKRMEILGEEHILSIPKQLADLYLEQKKYDEALVLYEMGLDTYKAIHMDKEKQCINLLKNLGSCCFELKKVDKSLTCFHKAMELAERWLEGDQRVKVLLYSVSATAYEFKGNRSQARECAQNALEMAERLKMSLSEKHKQNLERIREGEGAEIAD